jgi:hypothetical protein
MESTSTPQTTSVPHGLRDPAFRFLPLFRGSKAALVDGDTWQQGLPYDEILENFFNGSQALPSMVGQRKGQLIQGGDVGVRLEKSGEHGLVVLDADLVLDQPYSTRPDGSITLQPTYHDGRLELTTWLREQDLVLPETLTVGTPGRDDGAHAPGGWHLYYQQNPAWRVLGLKKPTEHVEVKTNGIVRFTDRCEVLRDLPVAVLPEKAARVLQGVVTRRAARAGARLGGSSLAEQGVNSALVCLRGWLTENGVWWNDDQIKDIVRHANAVLDVPMDEDRLEKTVLKNKAWTRGGQ